MKLFLIPLSLVLYGFGPVEGCELPRARQSFSGTVVRVIDVDTLVLRTAACEALHIRLANFDGLELREPGGRESRAVMVRLAQGQQASCVSTKGRSGNYRSFGRAMARCSVNGRDLGSSLRAMGLKEGGR
jgi:micrococcal nuclease